MPHKFPPDRRHALVDPDRRRVLDPDKIISFLPIEPDHQVIDVGCGNGFFTFPLAGYLVDGRAYAVDIQEEMLGDVRRRVEAEGIENIDAVLSQEMDIALPSGSADGVFSAFMFHETYDPEGFLLMLRRVLRPGGWLALLEWHKREMESGPPLADRIEEQDCLGLLEASGFQVHSRPYLSDEHYVFVMRSPAL